MLLARFIRLAGPSYRQQRLQTGNNAPVTQGLWRGHDATGQVLIQLRAVRVALHRLHADPTAVRECHAYIDHSKNHPVLHCAINRASASMIVAPVLQSKKHPQNIPFEVGRDSKETAKVEHGVDVGTVRFQSGGGRRTSPRPEKNA